VPAPRGPQPDQVIARAELLRVDFPPGAVPPVDPGVFSRRGSEVASAEGPFEPGGRVPFADPTLSAFDPLDGRLVRYAVRWRDTKGRPSPLTLAPDLTLAAPPSTPAALAAESVPGGVRLSWEPPAGGAPSGYNLYRAAGEAPFDEAPRNAEPILETSYLDPDVQLGSRYRYAVRALAAAGRPPREGDSSEVASVLAADHFPPDPPRDLVAVREGDLVRVFWTPGPEPDLAGYRVERSVDGGAWEPAADALTQAQWLDGSPPPGTLGYRVRAYDRAEPPNFSEPSAVAEIAPPLPVEAP
jgi:hypothetical protein